MTPQNTRNPSINFKKRFPSPPAPDPICSFQGTGKKTFYPPAESVWVGCWAVTSEFPQVISCFQLSRTSSPSRCPVAGHWTWDPLSFAALSYQPLWPPRRYDVKPHWQHHATFGEIWLLKIPMSSANLFGWLGEAQTRMAANIYGGKQS